MSSADSLMQPLQWFDHIVPGPFAMFEPFSRGVCLTVLAITAAVLSGCSSVNSASNRLAGVVTPYKVDVVQGNFVSREQREALKEGMGRMEVRDILGTPLLASIFHADRWDYVFTMRRQGVAPQARRVTVFFKDDRLQRVEADPLPTEAEFVASVDARRGAVKVPSLQMTEEQLKATTVGSVKPAPAKSLAPLPATYPPLEPAAN
jgi:outer membrane protein assembly factor BamE